VKTTVIIVIAVVCSVGATLGVLVGIQMYAQSEYEKFLEENNTTINVGKVGYNDANDFSTMKVYQKQSTLTVAAGERADGTLVCDDNNDIPISGDYMFSGSPKKTNVVASIITQPKDDPAPANGGYFFVALNSDTTDASFIIQLTCLNMPGTQ